MGVSWSSPYAVRPAPSGRPASPPGGPRGAHFASHDATRGWPADDARARPRRRRWPAVLTPFYGWSQDRPHLRHAEFIDALARINRRTL